MSAFSSRAVLLDAEDELLDAGPHTGHVVLALVRGHRADRRTDPGVQRVFNVLGHAVVIAVDLLEVLAQRRAEEQVACGHGRVWLCVVRPQKKCQRTNVTKKL